MYKFENLFSNLKVISQKTDEKEIQAFLDIFKLQKYNFDIENFEYNFSSKKIIENLNSSLHNK